MTLPRLIVFARRTTFTWSRLTHPVNDWPCSPAGHNDNPWHPVTAA